MALSTISAEEALELAALSRDTLVILAGKAATAAGIRAAFEHLWTIAPHGDQYVIVTDASTELVPIAASHRLRRTFLDPGDVAGEYGALSLLGLVAAAAIGVDTGRLLSRAEHLVHDCVPLIQPADNAGAWLGAIVAEAGAQTKKVTVVCPEPISSFGAWAARVVARGGAEAESTSRPSASADRLFVYLRLGNEFDGAVRTLHEAGAAVVTITLRDRFDLGEEFFRWEFASVVSAALLGVTPFANAYNIAS
jgi:hypothetical protein